jgi:hypothetical protein
VPPERIEARAMAEAANKIKRGQASLNGGIIVGLGVFALSMLVAGELGWGATAQWIVSLVVGGAFGVYVRLADL